MNRIKRPRLRLACIVASAALAGGAAAAPEAANTDNRIDLVQPQMVDLTDAYSARHLLDLAVRDADGKSLGEVHDLVVAADGRVENVIVESQGFLEMGDTHVQVPWDQLKVATNGGYATVPVRESNLSNFSFFNRDEGRSLGADRWTARALLGDILEIRQAMTYRTVDDLVIDRSGQVRSVVVKPARPIGPYGSQFENYGEAFDPAHQNYSIAAGHGEIANLGPFDISKLGLVEEPAERQAAAGQ
jgi:sporulation protein YlmC with PRC-barrel domain